MKALGCITSSSGYGRMECFWTLMLTVVRSFSEEVNDTSPLLVKP